MAFNKFFFLLSLFMWLLIWNPSAARAEPDAKPVALPDVKIYIYGNHVYDDETILKIAGIDYEVDPSLVEMQRKLETTGYFSSVLVSRRGNIVNIVVREKTPWFVFPYFSSDSNKKIYGLGGGMMGIGGGHTMLIGRVQSGTGSKAAALLYRDEFFLDSLWIFGLSFDYENADHDIYRGREVFRRTPNEAANVTQQIGYHLLPNLSVQFDTHVEQHKFEEAPGRISRGTQVSHRMLAEYGSYYLNEGLARGFILKPYIEFTNPLSTYQFLQIGLLGQKSVYLNGDFNWISRPRFEHGNPLPFYQQFELGGARLRGFPSQSFRSQSYGSLQNDFLLTSWNVWKLKIRPMVFADFAYVEDGGRTGLGAGLQFYFRQVAVPAIQIYGGYGFHPDGFAMIAAIGPQI